MRNHIFITGTDTDVGKTVVSSWLCTHFSYAYFKPIQSGSQDGYDSTFVKQISNTTIINEQYILSKPFSPHFAAELENIRIDINTIKLPKHQTIIEGAGGILTPIGSGMTMLDIPRSLQIPVIVVVRNYVGAINSACMTLKILRMSNIEVLGVILNGPQPDYNLNSIIEYGNVCILDVLPTFEKLDSHAIRSYIPSKELEEVLN